MQEYIQSKTENKIKPEDLNKISAAILSDVDPSLSVLKEKILAYSATSDARDIIRQSVSAVDLRNIKIKEKWMQAFYNEAIKEGLSHSQMSDMLVSIGMMPGTDTRQFLNDLIEKSEEPLTHSLKSIDLKKEKIKSPRELLLFLLTNKDKVKYPDQELYKAIADLITSKNIPDSIVSSQQAPVVKTKLWLLWLALGAGFCFIFFIFMKRRKDRKK